MVRIGWRLATSLCLLAVACGGGDGGRADAAGTDLWFPTDVAADPGAQDPGTVRDSAPPDSLDDEGIAADQATSDPGVTDEGAGDVATQDPGATDPGAADPGPSDPGASDPGQPDDLPVDVDSALKQAGESCEDFTECANGMSCIAGQYTRAHCNPMCATAQDCLAAAPSATNPQCSAIGGYQVCIWYCGMMGGSCPGDLQCDGATCG